MSRPRVPRILLPPHVHRTVARGREYFTYHPFRGTSRAGERIRLPGVPTLPNGEPNPMWWSAYRLASGNVDPDPIAGSFAALIEKYTGREGVGGSTEWQKLSDNTKRNYRGAFQRILLAWADLPVRALEPRHVLALRDSLSHIPQAANTLLTALSSLISWSIPRGLRNDNPCDHVRKFTGSSPWLPWSWDAIDAWRELAVPELRLAMALALYTGQRLSDILLMTWADVDTGVIQVVQESGEVGQQKTKKKVWVPLHRNLRVELSGIQRRSTRILTTTEGRPWTLEGFKTMWQRQFACIELVTGACHGLVFHGLRKSAVCFLLEAGCSEQEVEAITRQSHEMIRHYALELNRHGLAQKAIEKWENNG